ncbi:PREDICTED: uncharacterized protein LOC108357945 [Rhagoletis zephyria]|uniref:uncharacterized protein LOC108357945 n=1 Tax=Rhagoletis zephyria TaxID=28612 RepID=UPI000811735F|nr:PREDICTED: uncharacterized protein LOC108357945 [Rhagoletis zephyria]
MQNRALKHLNSKDELILLEGEKRCENCKRLGDKIDQKFQELEDRMNHQSYHTSNPNTNQWRTLYSRCRACDFFIAPNSTFADLAHAQAIGNGLIMHTSHNFAQLRINFKL